MLLFIAILLSTTFVSGTSLERAEALCRDGDCHEAREWAAAAVTEAEADSDTTGLIKALCVSANIAVRLGDDASAAEFYNRCSGLTGFGEPMFMLTSSLYNIAMIYYQNGEFEKAAEYVNKSICIDSLRASDSVLALKYFLAARIAYGAGNYSEALESASKGKSIAVKRKNHNILGRLIFMETLCREALAGNNPDWPGLEEGYNDALRTLLRTVPGNHYGAVNPYAGEVLYHLGLSVEAQGKDGKPYLVEALRIAGTQQKMRGDNPMVELDCCRALSAILEGEGNKSGAALYIAKADSLSFVPYVKEMSTNLALSQMEFIRRDRLGYDSVESLAERIHRIDGCVV